MGSTVQGLSFPLGSVLPLPPPLSRSRSKLCPFTSLMAREGKVLRFTMLNTGPQGLVAPQGPGDPHIHQRMLCNLAPCWLNKDVYSL